MPNVLPQAIVVLMTDMVGLLVAIVTLGYLGIGITPPTPDWGTMIPTASRSSPQPGGSRRFRALR
ncbi:hypothetical protein HMSSN036_57440 [Paenibacillus macerans]|nr:hypothetical protein HMSSN036_57440 [Paenibacillus macerans]